MDISVQESICRVLKHSQDQTTKSEERWRKILPDVRNDIAAYGIDEDPKYFDVLTAKIITGEIKGNKGVCLLGPRGSGKTKRAKIISDLTGIEMIPADEIGPAWVSADGDENYLREYVKAENVRWSSVRKFYFDIFLDDLGSEEDMYVSYGNACDVLRRVLEMRYKVFPYRKTHITTNLTIDELKLRYGERIFSRLHEMCVFVSVKHPDRRMTC